MSEDLYKVLKEIFDEAYERASTGKGAERHGLGLPFEQQPILQIQRACGSIHFPIGQILKKAPELLRFDTAKAKQNELLDIMVYAAGAYLYLEEQKEGDN
jgi:hypothetical protein